MFLDRRAQHRVRTRRTRRGAAECRCRTALSARDSTQACRRRVVIVVVIVIVVIIIDIV